MSDVNPPLALERGMERFSRFRVFNKESYFFLELLVLCRTLRPKLPACRSQIGINDGPVAHASISLKKSLMELYVFPLPFLISAVGIFNLLKSMSVSCLGELILNCSPAIS